MFGLFLKKKEVEKVKEETRKGFENVKKDLSSVGEWIKHLDSEKKIHKGEIKELKEILSTMKEDMDELKNLFSLMNEMGPRSQIQTAVQTPNRVFKEQTAVCSVQTAVQTAVQTPNLDQFSITERAIIWVLLNTDMKLSYDDLAAMLGKEKSTIRGQINAIKQKSEVIEETIEKNGKKRLSIPEEIKEKMLKKVKVRVNGSKKPKKH
jgi:hypothetical protein